MARHQRSRVTDRMDIPDLQNHVRARIVRDVQLNRLPHVRYYWPGIEDWLMSEFGLVVGRDIFVPDPGKSAEVNRVERMRFSARKRYERDRLEISGHYRRQVSKGDVEKERANRVLRNALLNHERSRVESERVDKLVSKLKGVDFSKSLLKDKGN